MSYRIECAQAVCSHYADLTAAQWLLLLALLGRNNALLSAPLAKWECLHIEKGEDCVNTRCREKYPLPVCLSDTRLLGNHKGIVGHSAALQYLTINRVMVDWVETDGGHNAQSHTVTHIQESSHRLDTLNYI